MNQHCTPNSAAHKDAVAYLCDIFTQIVRVDGRDLLESESLCLKEGHKLLAQAFARALERFDQELCCNLSEGVRVHDRRDRTLATMFGDVSFKWHRCRDVCGNTIIPLADALDIPWGARVSPAARSFLVNAGAEVSFLKSADLLEQAGGSRVSATCVMGAVHKVGELCVKEDAIAARQLYVDGVVPKAESEHEDVCIEADGIWIRLQANDKTKSSRVEIKALVSYAGKQACGSKSKRIKPVRHGCVEPPEVFWKQSVAAIGEKFDLAKIKTVHFGCDGESFYKDGAKYLPVSVKSDTHLDPFHVNRAILSCFPKDKQELAHNILGAVIDGDINSAAALIEFSEQAGIAKKNSTRVATYLRNNEEIIYTEGPSLGTMESEQQHLYGSRMDSVPCAWSIMGADSMTRLRSRKYSGRQIPHPTRIHSITSRRKHRTEKREIAYYSTKIDTHIPYTTGKGFEAEHVASLAGLSAEVRYAGGVDFGMIAI